MAQNLVINGVTYNGVDSLSIPTSGGGKANFVDVNAVETNTKSYEVTLAKATGWVLMTTLDDEVIAHINDAHLIVSLVKISDNELVKQCTTGGFTTNTPIGTQSGYPVYGACLMTTGDTTSFAYHVYYPPNYTETSTSLGGRMVFRLSGKQYYVSIPSYFIHEGTYRLTFTW